MNKKESVRRYKFSDAVLKQKALQFQSLISRDIDLLSTRGMTAARQAEFTTAFQEFFLFPSDTQFESDKMIKSENKIMAREDLEKQIRDIQFMASMAFYDKPAYIKAFGEADLTRQTDADLVQTGLEASTAINKYRTQLEAEGLTATIINTFNTICAEFQRAYQEQQEAINDRDINTNVRIELGNKLYDLVVKYALLGQNVWQSKDEAKYNDYLIYDHAASIETAEADDTIE